MAVTEYPGGRIGTTRVTLKADTDPAELRALAAEYAELAAWIEARVPKTVQQVADALTVAQAGGGTAVDVAGRLVEAGIRPQVTAATSGDMLVDALIGGIIP